MTQKLNLSNWKCFLFYVPLYKHLFNWIKGLDELATVFNIVRSHNNMKWMPI